MIITGMSAIDWWRTPPKIRAAWLTQEQLLAADAPTGYLVQSLSKQRSNAAEPIRHIQNRLLGDLKGVRLPIHLLVSQHAPETKNALVQAHRMYREIPRSYVRDIGNGLSVVSPAVALVQVAGALGFYKTLELMYEFCGIFTRFTPTHRARAAMNQLKADGEWEAASRKRGFEGVFAYYTDSGSMEPMYTPSGERLPWTPCFTRRGAFANMCKRPPLISCDDLAASISELGGIHGIQVARKAVRQVQPGAGSPLEVKMNMIVSLPPRYGGEGWPLPHLNRRIAFSPAAKAMTSADSCVGDLVWSRERVVLEVIGFDFHADEEGFKISSGRTSALEAMGYTVIDITYDQMSSSEALELKLERLGQCLGVPLQKRTVSFLGKRQKLHAALFSHERI